jgi:hypothetical protein
VSDRETLSKPLETLVRAVAGRPDDDQRASTFARGLALGALVGAAIAGSTIWQRRQATTARRAPRSTSSPIGPLRTSEGEPPG